MESSLLEAAVIGGVGSYSRCISNAPPVTRVPPSGYRRHFGVDMLFVQISRNANAPAPLLIVEQSFKAGSHKKASL